MIQEAAIRRRNNLLRFVKDSFPLYKAGWVHKDICERLEKFSKDVEQQKSPRLMLFMPPRHGKSFIASERFPVWHLGRNPSHQILLTSYGQILSDKFSKRARSLARSQIVTESFPNFILDSERQAVQEWETSAGGGYRSVGIGGGATGTGCDILIIDDPIKNAMEANSKAKRDSDWEWYQTTAYTRLMPGGGILIIQTRWHEDDLSGRLLKATSDEGDNWETVIYPAIAEHDESYRKAGEALHPERFDIVKLTRIKNVIKSRAWNSLYQQRPTSVEGSLFKREWWRYFSEIPSRFERVIQSWDCSFKGGEENDFVAGFTVGKIGADYYLLDRVKGKFDFVETIPQVKNFSEKWPDAKPILIEDKANGPAVISSLKGKISGLLAFLPEGSKEARATVCTPIVESGNIFLPRDASWVPDFIEEAASFPKGMNDDQVDAMTQALIYLQEEGKLAVFDNISEIFSNPSVYPSADWHTNFEGHREVFIGVKWGSGNYPHVFYALSATGATLGYQRVFGTNHYAILEQLKKFSANVGNKYQPIILSEASGFGETMCKVIADDTTMDWRCEYIKLGSSEIDLMVTVLKDSFLNKKLALKPWSVLFDQMAFFRCEETDKGTFIYGPPEGLSANAVFALMLAHEAWRKYSGEVTMAVINEVEKNLTKIYYGSGDFDDFD